MTTRGVLFSIAVVSFGLCIAGTRIPPNSKIFVTPMEGGLDTFIVAEIMNQEVPLAVVTTEEDADFILVGSIKEGDNKWYHVMFQGGRDRNQGAIQLVDVKGKRIAWAGSAGDRNLWAGEWARRGAKKIAKKLVKEMNNDLFG